MNRPIRTGYKSSMTLMLLDGDYLKNMELYCDHLEKALDKVCEELAKKIIYEVDSEELTYAQLNILKNNLIDAYLKDSFDTCDKL